MVVLAEGMIGVGVSWLTKDWLERTDIGVSHPARRRDDEMTDKVRARSKHKQMLIIF